MTTFHRDLTGADLHEPKGIDTAQANTLYVADGVDSGGWKKLRMYGYENNADNGNTQVLNVGTDTVLTNDTFGGFDTDFLLPGRASRCWNPSLSAFDFLAGGINVNELLEFTFDFSFTSSGNGSILALDLVFAANTVDEFQIRLMENSYKTSGTHSENTSVSLFMPSQTFIDNPCEVHAFTDDTAGTIVVNRFYLKVVPIYPVAE